MASSGVWTASSSVGNSTCSWPQEALNSSTKCFKPISKWRILRIFFNCTRKWRDVGRQAENLKVRYTLDLQFRSVEVNHDLAISKPSAVDTTHPMKVSSAVVRGSLEDTQQCDKPHHGCEKSCISQDLISFGQVHKQCLFPLIFFAQPNSTHQPILAVVAFSVVFLSLECDQYPTDHVDWGGLATSFLFRTLVTSKTTCVSIVTLFQAASILLFQAAYFWLKFREVSSSGRKRKSGYGEDVHKSVGVYARSIKDRDGMIRRYKYEPRFKPPREKNGRIVQSFQNLSLGGYNSRRDAEIVRQIAAFYYNMDKDFVFLEEGHSFRIPAMSPEHGLSGLEKAKWVSEKAKEVFESHCKPNTTFTTEWPQSGGLPDTSLTEILSVSVIPTSTISHSDPGGAPNSTHPVSDNSLPEESLVCIPNRRSNEQLRTEVDLQAADEKQNISRLAIQHSGVSTDLNNMVVDKEGETIQVVDQSVSRASNFNQAFTQPTGPWENAAAQLNTMQGIEEFLFGNPEDVVQGNRVELHQSEGSVSSAYCQLQPHFSNPAPCNATVHVERISQSEPAAVQYLPYGTRFETLECGAATSSAMWGLDALKSEGAQVSPQQGSHAVIPALGKVTPSLLTNSCSDNCVPKVIVEVMSLQQQKIKDLEHEIERLKESLRLKCSFCCSQPYY